MKSNTPGDGSWAFQGTYLEGMAGKTQERPSQHGRNAGIVDIVELVANIRL